MSTIVVAFGGNAILQTKQRGTFEEQYSNVEAACGTIVDLVRDGHRVVVTHGNGPQVGNILLQNEEASGLTPSMPLDACGAESQGLIGYMIQQGLGNRFSDAGMPVEVVTLLTQVEVDPSDPAFSNPTKPIGPFYTAEKARRLMDEGRYQLKEDAGRGWRRVVPSPEPRAIVEREAIKRLLDQGCVVIASGGGGIPVVRDENGKFRGVEAVIDKDLAAERLAQDINADLLMVLTDVERVYINYGQPGQAAIERMTAAEGRRYQAEGHFRAGSMGPKVEAALRFVESGRGKALIGSLGAVHQALKGESGTWVVAGKEDWDTIIRPLM